MDLTGGQRAAIRKALVAAFPTWGALQILVDDRLSEQLHNISAPVKNMPEVAHDLVIWAQARGRITELVIGASAENPMCPELMDLAARFKFSDTTHGELERIVLPSVQFENVGRWLDKLSRLRRAVARFEPQPCAQSKAGFGTGFLVAPDLLMTNWHVVKDHLSSAKNPQLVVIRFDYEVDVAGAEGPERLCGLADAWDCGHSSLHGGLDYALVRLREAPGNDPVGGTKRGFIKVDGSQRPGDMEPLMILQHPDAMPLKLSIGTVNQLEANGHRVTYNANTLGGSSGSPCFNSALEPVALHHWGDVDHNRGVRLDAILEDLRRRNLDGLLG
jgi:hypothetical protein